MFREFMCLQKQRRGEREKEKTSGVIFLEDVWIRNLEKSN